MNDTIDRLVLRQLAPIAREPFKYKGCMVAAPFPLVVSPLLFRDFNCYEKCGACCIRVTLDWVEGENSIIPADKIERKIEINDIQVPITTFTPKSNSSRVFCDFLDLTNGRCAQYLHRPFSCEFEHVRFVKFKEGFALRTSAYGRSWRPFRVDGKKGMMCDLKTVAPSQDFLPIIIHKLSRLEFVASKFGFRNTKISELLEIISDRQFDVNSFEKIIL